MIKTNTTNVELKHYDNLIVLYCVVVFANKLIVRLFIETSK